MNHRTQIYLPEDLYQLLKERARLEGTTFAHQVRVAVKAYLGDGSPLLTDDSLWSLVGDGDGGPEDLARNHDSYLYGEHKP